MRVRIESESNSGDSNTGGPAMPKLYQQRWGATSEKHRAINDDSDSKGGGPAEEKQCIKNLVSHRRRQRSRQQAKQRSGSDQKQVRTHLEGRSAEPAMAGSAVR